MGETFKLTLIFLKISEIFERELEEEKEAENLSDIEAIIEN